MKRIVWIILGCLVVITTAQAASDANNCLVKTWKGTVGKTPVMIQFDEIPNEAPIGKYYYRTSTVDLLLKLDKIVPDQWQEFDQNNNLTGLLHITCTGNTLSGEWKSPDGKKSFSIRAEIAESYSEARQNALKTSVFKRARIGTHEYEIIVDKRAQTDNTAVERVRLLGNSKELLKINKALLEGLKDDVDMAVSCAEAGKEYTRISKVIFWNDEFVVIYGEGGDNCSGAPHPDSFSGSTTYNLLSGERENISLWLTTPYRMEIKTSSGLGKILSQAYLKQRGEEDGQECLEVTSFSENGWPTDEGITFISFAPYASSGCQEKITIPYNVLWPYLTPLGQSHAKSFLWGEAQKADTIDVYQVYLEAFPQGSNVPIAKERIQKLKEIAQAASERKEEQAWDTAKKEDSEASFGIYLEAYPSGRFSILAKARIEELKNDVSAQQEANLWNKARNTESRVAVGTYLNKYPSGRYLAAANAKLQAIKESEAAPIMVRIPGKNYEMGKYEVSQKEWRDVMGNNPSKFQSCGDTCPVEQVSWNDIQRYLQKLNAKTGRQYRLPTEEEWEHACYGGTKTEYCGGNDINSVAWYGGNSNNTTHPTGQKQANGYGLYDMTGNVMEFMNDCYKDNCWERVIRGGFWGINQEYNRATLRLWEERTTTSDQVGFRLARTLDYVREHESGEDCNSNKTLGFSNCSK